MIMQARYDAQNPAALKRIVASGVTTRPFSEDLMVAARAAANEQLEAGAAADPGYRTVYEHWKAFRDDNFAWFGLAEKAYGNFSFK